MGFESFNFKHHGYGYHVMHRMSDQYNYTLDTYSAGDAHPAGLELSPKRRNKHNVPDTDKDEKYWEKRKRNNLSAKKSRQLKQLAEKSIKERMVVLYEENALLKFELSILKRRLGLSEDESILTEAERDTVINNLKQGTTIDFRKDGVNSRDSYSSEVSAHSNSTETSSYEEMSGEFPFHPDIKPGNLPAHVAFLNSNGVYTTGDHVNASLNYNGYQSNAHVTLKTENGKRKADSECDSIPTDLSTKRRKSSNVRNIVCLDEINSKAGSKTKDVVDLTSECGSELRTKLQLLSAQVEKMQKLVGCD